MSPLCHPVARSARTPAFPTKMALCSTPLSCPGLIFIQLGVIVVWVLAPGYRTIVAWHPNKQSRGIAFNKTCECLQNQQHAPALGSHHSQKFYCHTTFAFARGREWGEDDEWGEGVKRGESERKWECERKGNEWWEGLREDVRGAGSEWKREKRRKGGNGKWKEGSIRL